VPRRRLLSRGWRFNPRLPCGRRRREYYSSIAFGVFQSTPPMREATRISCSTNDELSVSIHASHAGGDAASAASRRM